MNTKALFLPLTALCLSSCVNVITDASTKSTRDVQNVQIGVTQVQQENKVDAISTSETGNSVTVISPDELLQKVILAKRPFATGWSSSTGMWMISRQKVKLKADMTNNEAIAIAEIRAKKKIAEFLGSNISAKDSVFMSISNEDGKKQYKKSVSSFSSTSVDQFLRGVTLLKAERKNDVIFASFYVTGKMIDATKELERQLRQAPPGTVRTSGYAVIVNNRIPPAKQAALQIALRNAVEQVMGTTVVGQSSLMNNAKLKSKVISNTVGKIKRYRIVKESIVGINYQVIAVSEIDKDSLLDNYSSLVRSMGNPGFFINTEDPDLRTALNGFMKKLGFMVTASSAAAHFIVDAGCSYMPINDEHYGQGIQIDIHLRLLNKKTGEIYMTLQNTPRLTSTFSGTYHQIRQTAAKRAFKEIKKPFHNKLNKVVFDWVTNGHSVSIVFQKFNGDAQYASRLERAISNIPGATVLNKEQNATTIVFKCSCVGPTSDVEEFLRDAMVAEFGENVVLPQTVKIELDEIQLNCSK